MSNTKIKALIGFSDGVISMAVGEIREVESTKASAFISGGLAVEYTDPVVPSGSVNINANGTHDVAGKASAVVNVAIKTITYNVNGGTGSVDPVQACNGNTITLDNGAGITPPAHSEFIGWNTESSATEAISSTYSVTGDATLYAIYQRTEYVVTYNANGGTGSIDPVTVTAGQSTNLNNGSTLEAPEGKVFSGWADSADAEEPNVESPYTPTADITLYAVYEAE